MHGKEAQSGQSLASGFRLRASLLVLTVLITWTSGLNAQAIKQREQAPKPPTIEELVDQVFTATGSERTPDIIEQELADLCIRIALTANESSLEKIALADAPRRVMHDINAARDSHSLFLAYRESPLAFESLAYVLRVETKDRAPSYQTLARLAKERSKDVTEYPNLAAAVAAVHEKQFVRSINENVARGSSARELFDYFVKHRQAMALDPASTPAEVLVYVVDSAAPVRELEWALEEYRNRKPNLDRCYFQIRYDDSYFKRGTEKKLTASGRFDLPAIQKYGGVCADQAHYATHVGKAFGIPTAYVRGRGVDVAHAWVGEFVIRGSKSEWNFDSGRYDGYENLRGEVMCPVSGRWISDGEVALIAEFAKHTQLERRTAAALIDVAARLNTTSPTDTFEPILGLRQATKPRTIDINGQLELLRLASEACPHDAMIWRALASEAKQGRLTMSQMKSWADDLLKLSGKDYADFSFEVLADMISAVPDADEQSRMWDWAFDRFSRRPDLASAARFRQASMWEKTGDPSKAWDAYNDVAMRFANESPDTVPAVEQMLNLLSRNQRRKENATPMLEKVWKRIRKPDDFAVQFRAQSNWYRVGVLLAREHERNGDTQRAGTVRRRLGMD